MAEQHRENHATSSARPAQIEVTDIAYLQDPAAVFARMRDGFDVVAQPTNGCARMTLSALLMSDVQLDD
jgi:hypothetical protein